MTASHLLGVRTVSTIDRLPARSAAPGASFAPLPALRPATPSSYRITLGTPEQLAALLVAQGWRDEGPRCPAERARLRRGRALVVLYGRSALVQGDPQPGHAALAALVAEGGA